MSPDAQVDVDVFAADLVAKYRRWHRCTDASDVRDFTSVGRPGRSWIQTCGADAETFARAVIVDGGQGLLTFTEVGTAGATAQDRLISFLENVELTGPAGS